MNLPPRNLRAAKQALRKTMLQLRNKQPLELILQKSDRILTKFMDMTEYKSAKVIMLYSGKGKEVQTEKLIRAALKDKRVILPITNVKKHILELSEIKDYDLELEKSTFDILEPKNPFTRLENIEIIDLIVVPAVAFDFYGNRLGYGFAYYDKLLSTVRRSIPFIGFAFGFQVKNRIPHSRYDVPVHYIVTEENIIQCK